MAHDALQGQLSGKKDWVLQIILLELFNAVTSVAALCKFYQAFIDTAEYIFSYTDENQHSVENSEHLVSVCTESEGTFCHHFFLVLGFWLIFFVVVDIFFYC